MSNPSEIRMRVGQNRTVRVTVKSGGQIVPLTGASLVLNIKRVTSDMAVLITKSTTVGVEGSVTFPSKGKAEFYLLPADTSALTPATYVYDIWVTLAGGETYPVIVPTPLLLGDRV